MNPQHIRHIQNENRRAVAPYNFVELPEKVILSESEGLKLHNQYSPDRHTGEISCTLTTSSPLYIRGGFTPDDFTQFGEESSSIDKLERLNTEQRKRRADFFAYPQNRRPVIPGSSLRGMLRSLIEIISYGKIDKVSDTNLVYRAVGDTTSLGDAYRNRLLKDAGNGRYRFLMKAGYVIATGKNSWSIRPAKELIKETSFARIEEDDIPNNLGQWAHSRNAFEISVNVAPCQFHPHNSNRIQLWYAKASPTENSQNNGVVVETGWAPRKHMQFVFGFPRQEPDQDIQITDVLVDKYKEQVTEGQQTIVGSDGILKHMQPVFYLVENNQLVFFGHAMMFRIPYLSSLQDFIPDNLKSADQGGTAEGVDLAEAMFGYARAQKAEQAQACKGRIKITDANCSEAVDKAIDSLLVPKILSGPKPTTFQHYLVQPPETKADRRNLKHYTSQPNEETVLRGHKLYWHKGNVSNSNIKAPREAINKAKSQYTEIKPIKSGITFDFKVYFENLSDVELGALLWVLDIAQDEQYRLSLGMGKPLGMGAVKITHKLTLDDRENRYEKLFEDNNWHIPINESALENTYIQTFEEYILNQLGSQSKSLRERRRIQMLLAMLEWQETLSPEQRNQRRYMEIERKTTNGQHYIQGDRTRIRNGKINEYNERPVLPTPFQVLGTSDLDIRQFSSEQKQPKQSELSARQKEIKEITQSHDFNINDILDATVLKIKGKKITYEMLGGLKKTVEEHKLKQFPEVGAKVKVKITSLKENGEIKKVRLVSE